MPSKDTARPRTLRRFLPSFERLEDRTVPAGNVSVFVDAGVLFVVGDGEANRVSIARTGERSAFVRPLDSDTAINGRVAELWVGDITRGYDVKLHGGDDVLVISNVSAKMGLRVETGDGNDEVFLDGVESRRRTDILLGAGNDALTITGSNFRKRTTIDLQDGDDQLSVGGTKFGRDTYLAGGAGANSFGAVDEEFRRTPTITGFPAEQPTLLPRANDDAAGVEAGGTVAVPVLANDRATVGQLAPASLTITSGPTAGTASVSPDGLLTYTSTGTAAVTDTIRYTVRNSGGAVSNEATVVITVGGPTSPPTSPPVSPPPTSPPVSPPPVSPPPGDTSPPNVSLSTTTPGPNNLGVLDFRVEFDEPVLGFVLADLSLTNGTASNLVVVDERTYTFQVTPTVDGTVAVSVPGNVAADAAGNGNTPSNAVSVLSDRTAPVPTLTTSAFDPTDESPLPFIITFTEAVPAFTAGDLAVANGSVTNFVQVNPRRFTFDVVPVTGVVTVSLPAGATSDPAGNGNAASDVISITFTGDSEVTTSLAAIGPNPNPAAQIPFSVTFGEDVTGFDQSDVAVTNGSVTNFTAVDAATYTFDVVPAADGTVTVNLATGAGTGTSGRPTAAAIATVTSDRSEPVTTIVSTAATEPTFASPIPFRVTFTEPVGGFDQTDLVVTNGTVSGFTVVSSTTYDLTVIPTADGPVTVSVPAAAGADAAGNPTTAAAVTVTSIRTDAGMTNTLPDVNDPSWQTLPSGVRVWDVQVGAGSTPAQPTSTVAVFYTGWLTDGTVFDSARTTGSPAVFPLSNLIAGWQEGVPGMLPGGIRRLYIPSALAYGPGGSPPNIPPNADLIFEIKLVAVV